MPIVNLPYTIHFHRVESSWLVKINFHNELDLIIVIFAEAVAEIAGTSDLHIDEGSTLRLECKLKRATENPSFIFW